MEGEAASPPPSVIHSSIILKNLCYLNREGIGIDYDTVIEWAGQGIDENLPSRFDSRRSSYIQSHADGQRGHSRRERSFKPHETDSDDEVLSDASTVIIDGHIDLEVLEPTCQKAKHLSTTRRMMMTKKSQ